jgi:D-alanyl-D-alanine carboxypeptidase
MRKTRSNPRQRTPIECPEEIRVVLASLEIPTDLIAARSLVLHPEPQELVVAATGNDGREYLLVSEAAAKWREMSAAALTDGVVIKIGSAFRSVDRQAEIIRAKLAEGLSLEAVLCVSAPPGYSEHHSGRAIDVTTDEGAPLEPEFEKTTAFLWLSKNAGRFGFVLSYPAGNPSGYDYEPWHWCFRPPEV